MKTTTFKTDTQYQFGSFTLKVVDISKHFIFLELSRDGKVTDRFRRKPDTSIKERTDWLSDTEYTEHITIFKTKFEATSFN